MNTLSSGRFFHCLWWSSIDDSEVDKQMNEIKNYFHHWLLPMNVLQDGKPYYGRPLGISPKFMPLENSVNRDIMHSLRFHCVLSRFLLYREKRNMRFSLSSPKEIAQRTEAYTGIKNGNTFFGNNYPVCRSDVESVGNCLPCKLGCSWRAGW